MATFASDGIIGLAKAHHESVAAVLDDRSLQAIAYSVSKKGMDVRVLENLNMWGLQSVIEGSGWLVLAEQRPDRADEVRCDRSMLHKLLDTARDKGRVVLDDAAAYALAEPHFWENPISQAYLTGLIDSQAGRTLQQNDRNLLQFYGALDGNQRANAEHLSLASLTSFQTGLLEKLVYGANANLQQSMDEQPHPDENGQYENYWNTLAREATCSLGNGIPRSGFAKITLAKDQAILAHMRYDTWDQGEQSYDLRTLAWMMVSSDSQSVNSQWTVLGMRPSDRTQITFQFQYTDKVSQYMTLSDVVPKGKEASFVDQLPDGIRQALMKEIADAKKQMAQNAMYYSAGNGQVVVRGGPP
jgi:hypothetical protein